MPQKRYTAPTPLILHVRFYRSLAGSEPVRDWLLDLPKGDRRIIGQDVKTVQLGWPLGMPLVRKLESELWEVRSHVSGGTARILFTVASADMVLLHGFVKKSQKLPLRDAAVARRRLREIHGKA